MLDSILFKFQVLGSVCNTYYIVLFCFKVSRIIKDVFVVDHVEATLANHEIFMHCHT
jgi:hypothetical protein